MKNKLSDLNNHLFEQLERLNDQDIKGDQLSEEIRRSEAMATIAGSIIGNASLILKAHVELGGDHKLTQAQLLGSTNEPQISND